MRTSIPPLTVQILYLLIVFIPWCNIHCAEGYWKLIQDLIPEVVLGLSANSREIFVTVFKMDLRVHYKKRMTRNSINGHIPVWAYFIVCFCQKILVCECTTPSIYSKIHPMSVLSCIEWKTKENLIQVVNRIHVKAYETKECLLSEFAQC